VHTDRCATTSGQQYHAKVGRKETELQELMYRDTGSVEHEMDYCDGNNWGHRNGNKRFKDKCGSCTRKTFDRYITKNSCTWNITHNTESPAV